MIDGRPTAALLAGLCLTAGLAGCATLRGPPAGEHMLYAEVALERGEYPLAAQEYRLAAASSHDDRIAERAARVAFDNGQDGELARTAAAWIARRPDSEVAHRFLAVADLELDARPPAERELALLVTTAYATPADAFAALGESLSELRNDTGVARTVGSLARRYPGVAEAQYAAGTLALSAGDSPSALAAAGRALALKADWREARWLEARARIAGGDCDAGLREAGALSAESTDTDRLLYAWLLMACDRGAEARPYFEDLARGRAVRAEALEGLAGLDIDARRYDDAAGHYTEILATGRNADRAYYGLAVVADRRADATRAIRLYARVTSGPRAVAAQLRAYRLGLEHGEAAGAARLLDEFVANVPEQRVAATAGRAQILAEVGRIQDALALLARAERAYPDREELRYARATVLERSGSLDAALAELRAVAQRRPDDPNAQNALGFTLADHGLDLADAERRIRAALDARPDSAAVRDSYGWVLHRRGRSAEALGWLKRAYAADPDPEIAAHLGEVEWALGDHDGATHTWRDALERTPGDPHVQRALERFVGREP